MDILSILKTDLGISSAALDEYLHSVIKEAEAAITREGITINDKSTEDGMLIENYAAFLYRQRREKDQTMPKNLRRMLNNRLFSEKASE